MEKIQAYESYDARIYKTEQEALISDLHVLLDLLSKEVKLKQFNDKTLDKADEIYDICLYLKEQKKEG